MPMPDLQAAETPRHPCEEQFNPTEVSAPHPLFAQVHVLWSLVKDREGRGNWGLGTSYYQPEEKS